MRHQSPDGIEEVGIGDGAGGEKQSRLPHCPTSILLRVLVLVLDLLVDNAEGGEEVAQEEDGEGDAAHEDLWEERSQQEGPAWGNPLPGHSRGISHLPLLALGVLDHAEQGDGVVELPELQERGDSGQLLLSEAQPQAGTHPAAAAGCKPHTSLVWGH